MNRFRIALIVLGLAAYGIAFYATPLPSLRNDAGQPLLRFDLLWQLVWLPDVWLLPNWFGSPPEFSLLDRLPLLSVAGAILTWGLLLGWLLLEMIRAAFGDAREGEITERSAPSVGLAAGTPASRLTRLETFVFSLAMGLNAISTWVLLLGLLGVMNWLGMFLVPAILTVATAGYLYRRRPRLPAVAIRNSDGKGDSPIFVDTKIGTVPSEGAILHSYWLWAALPFVVAIFLAAMTPPLDFDVREYHLQAPKEFFQQGRIAFLPHNVYANMAMGTEMLSLLAMVISGDWWLGALAGKTAIAAFTPLTALALWTGGRRFASPTAGIVAALAYISIPWVMSIASGGFVEGASACYLFLAVYALLLAGEPPAFRFLALAGYLAGAAVATKYPAVLFVLLPLTIAVVWKRATPAASSAWRIQTWRKQVGQKAAILGLFLLAAMLACGLWFAKNWVLTGNPTYPLLYGLFDGQTWNMAKEQQWNSVHRPHDFSLPTLGNDLGRVLLTSDWLSPLVVPLAALVLVGLGDAPTRRRRMTLLGYVGFVVAVWWLFTHRIDRFWIPVLPVMALLAGLGACWTGRRWWRVLLLLMLATGLGANFLVATSGQGNAWFVSLKRLRLDPTRIDPWHAYFNAQADGRRLLCVGDAAVFDLTMPVLYNTCFDDSILEELVKGKTAAEVRAELQTREIAWVYVDWAEIDRYRRTYGFTDFVQAKVFDRLVAEGVLAPLPSITGHSGRAYRVLNHHRHPWSNQT